MEPGKVGAHGLCVVPGAGRTLREVFGTWLAGPVPPVSCRGGALGPGRTRIRDAPRAEGGRRGVPLPRGAEARGLGPAVGTVSQAVEDLHASSRPPLTGKATGFQASVIVTVAFHFRKLLCNLRFL